MKQTLKLGELVAALMGNGVMGVELQVRLVHCSSVFIVEFPCCKLEPEAPIGNVGNGNECAAPGLSSFRVSVLRPWLDC